MATSVTGKATEFIQFTRVSNATVTDIDGKVKWAPHNLLTNSESFDSTTSWGKDNSGAVNPVVTANAGVAPNGTTTADRIVFDRTGGTYSRIQQTPAVIVGANYTFAVWMKTFAGGTANVGLRLDTTGINCAVTGTWTKFEISGVGPAGAALACQILLFSSIAGNDLTADILVWGAHLYRSDLGGMQANTSAYPMYNPTTPRNLLGYTEDFSNAYWSKYLLNVTSNAGLAPNGLQTADRLTFTGQFAYVESVPAPVSVSGAIATISVWLKLESGNANLQLRGTTNSLIYNQSITVTSEWQRFSVTFTHNGTNNIGLILQDRNTSGFGSVLAWGAQISDSASLDPYVPVYGAAVTSAAYYGPRRDFDPVTLACKGLLVEEQRANLFLNSNAPTAGTGITITAGAAVSPDGSTNAYRIAKTDATDPRYFARSTSMTTVAGRTYTVSAWFKYDGFNTVVSLEYNSLVNWDVAWNAQFTVASTGVTTFAASNCTQSVQNVGNGWYRVIVTFTAGAAPTVTSNPSVLTRVTGASGVTVLGYGGQIEENASFATSYIPTGAATASRNGDVASVSTQAFPYNSTDGTWVANFQTIFSGASTGSYYLLNLDGSANKRVLYIGSGAEAIASFDGTTIVGTGTDITGPISKSANAYTSSERAVVSNGLTVITGASVASYATASTVNIGSTGSISGVGPLNGHIRQITYLPRRISNTELQTRTQ